MILLLFAVFLLLIIAGLPIAVAIGLIFKSEITEFVNDTFGSLNSSKF